MRRRFTIPLIAAVAVAPWLWFHPDREIPPAHLAELTSIATIPTAADWAGGFSGIEVTEDGNRFYIITDRGHIARGTLLREGGAITGVSVESFQPLVDRFGETREFPHTDAEGIALAEDGSVFVSFEHAHRILKYDTWEAPAVWPSYTRAWRALSQNGGLEALALDDEGVLYTLPEAIASGAYEALVYRRHPQNKWQQPFTIPVDQNFAPVGADFGPDGLFYLLERGIYPFGFYSRVRRMDVIQDGVDNVETVLTTPLGRHGNLEGVSVWQDDAGAIRLTLVSDDNFYPFMRSEVVEYRIKAGVALAKE